MKFRFTSLCCAFVATVALAVPAQAGLIFGFDPDGSGGAGAEVDVDTFDLAPGNALANDVIFGGGIGPGDTFDLLYQATFNGASLNGVPATSPLVFDGEITAVARFPEVITSFDPVTNTANFGLTGGGENYFRMYHDLAENADNLAGTGFDDGTLILEAVITQNSGSFSSDLTDIQDFDQFVDNDYPGFQTVTGEGGINITAEVTSFDSDYFDSEFGGIQEIVVALFSGSNNTPFVNVNPSEEFAFAGVTPALGGVNGINGPDFQFQADSAISFQERVVPEPASIAMFAGLGVVGLIGAYRRRKKA